MEGCKAIATPMNQKEKLSKDDGAKKVEEGIYKILISCLMYLIAKRPDILYPVSVYSRFLHYANMKHYKVAKRVLRYIKGTLDYDVQFKPNQVFKLESYFDLDWGGSLDDMKSTLRYCFTLGFGMFSWSSKKQEVVAHVRNHRACSRKNNNNNNKIFYNFHQGSIRKNYKSVVEVYTFLTINLLIATI